MTIPSTTRLNLSAAVASVTVAVVLVLLKLWALGETGALSVAASLADSAMDMMVSIGAMAAIFRFSMSLTVFVRALDTLFAWFEIVRLSIVSKLCSFFS